MASATTTDDGSGFGYPAALVWCGAVLFGVGSGTAAALLQRWFAPIGVFPLAVGVIAGLATGGLWAGRGGGSKRAILASASLAAFVCIATLHLASYFIAERDAEIRRREVHEQMFKLVPEPGVEFDQAENGSTLRRYFSEQWYVGRKLGEQRVKGWVLAAWWIGDALLLWLGATLAAAAVGKPLPSRGRVPPVENSRTDA
ncbi:MAG: hypothetical protein C0483_24585 [Pirellula sp.]|nr:hypothetical protein [Pirellula sp.]